jgi:DNA repair exonuclease SbcCD ATPase subunit
MFKFLKKAFKPDEAEQIVIRCRELPAWLDARERQCSEELAARTADSRGRIGNARERLLEMVDSLSSAERQEAYHPKLGQVTKSTLPLFEKAMHSACSRKFPDEPEEFYKAATESLKGCISGLKGQGRYLQAAYPTETYRMRLIIDEIGKEVNSMTPAIAEGREMRGVIREMRQAHADLLHYHAISADTGGSGSAIQAKIAQYEEEIANVLTERAAMDASAVSGDLTALRNRIEEASRQLDDANRDLAGTINVLLHVFHKAEKMAGRKHDAARIKPIKSAVSILERYESAGGAEVIGAVTIALPPVLEMIGTGDIVLKNKEEKAVFSSGDKVIPLISVSFEQYREKQAAFLSLEEAVTAHPHTRRAKDLNQRLRQLEGKLEEAKIARREHEERVSEARDAVPGIRSRLDGMIGDLLDGNSRITISYSEEQGAGDQGEES